MGEAALQREALVSWKADLWALFACMLLAVGLALEPHAVALACDGTREYLADGDDVLYLAIARLPYHGETGLRDPFASQDAHLPTLYAWAQFVPFARLTCWLGLTPLDQAIVWRTGGAMFLALALYTLFRTLFARTGRPVLWSTLCALICLSDAGFVSGRSFIANMLLIPHLWHGTTPMPNAQAIPQYRIVTPLTNLPFLLFFATCLISRWLCTWRVVLMGAAALTACIWIYFFYWTAAIIAGAGILLGWLAVAAVFGARRSLALRSALAIGVIGIGGLALGAPQILANWKTSQDPNLEPVLQRMERGAKIPPGDPVGVKYLRNTWAWAKIVLGLLAIVILRLWKLGPLWWFAVAGYALQCGAVVTGLEFENYHWGGYVASPFAEILCLGILVQGADRYSWGKAVTAVLITLATSVVMLAAVWRPYEAMAAPEAVRNSEILRELGPLRRSLGALGPDQVLVGPQDARVALLFGQAAQLYSGTHSAHCSLQPDSAVHERSALNAWVMGLERKEYERAAWDGRFQVGDIARPEWQQGAVVTARLACFDELESGHVSTLLTRYHPSVALVPRSHRSLRPYDQWKLLESTDRWELWVAEPVERWNNAP